MPALILLFLSFGAGLARAQMIDLNGNGMSDVWEQLYGASALDPNADTDGDGVPNRLESLAGTDPFDPNSIPKITSFANSISNFTVAISAAAGKVYQLQSVSSLDGTNWTAEASTNASASAVISLTAGTGSEAKFFRIAISDLDSDGDGLSDWEEIKLGLDPYNKFSNGQLDGNGQPMSDYAYAAGRLGSQNVLAITATDPTANEPDPGQSAINLGLLTVTRGGFPLTAVTVNLGLGGPGSGFATESVDHDPLPRSLNFPAGTTSQTISVTPLANTNLMTPVVATMKLLGGPGYSVGTASNASIVIYPSSTPNGTGLTGQYFTNSSTTYSNSANFNPANLRLTRVDTNIDFTWGNNTIPITNSGGHYTVRWTGQVQPEYSETYYFVANTDDGVRLWVNDLLIIDSWITKSASDLTGSIALQGGVRYNLKMEYFQSTSTAVAHLSWYSPSQSKQIIPTSRLYPTNTPPAPSAVTSPVYAVGFLGQPFSFTVTGANSPSGYTANGLPPGLAFNSTNGVISGVPNLAGDFQVSLTASNSLGLGASVVLIQIFDTGSSVVREVWDGINGANVSDIPVAIPATSTNTLGTLEGITDYGDNYGERIRGYLTAPVTGNYYFWLAASDSAELWISNDNEPVNKVKRAWVVPANNPVPPPNNGTASRQWNLQPGQKSGWLSLVAGQKYYIEILHKAAAGTNDNWAVGWVQDSTGTSNAPSAVIPGYVLSRYYPLPTSIAPGTLYDANMLAQQGISVSSAVGTATWRVSADGTQAILKFSYRGLTSPETAEHIHSDAYVNGAGTLSPSQIIFDIDVAGPQPDGSYVWNIAPVGTLSVADIQEIIKEGKTYINIHTVNFPAGEINGHFAPANGSQTFAAPPAPPAWTDDHANTNAAARFLIQATFGPSPNDLASVQTLGYTNWIDNQFTLPVSHHLPLVLANASTDPTTPYPSSLVYNTWWQQSITAPDQLRQRIAFALIEIMVISQNGVLQDNGRALSDYYDTLLDNAFGNFRELLEAVTLSPAMGLYLDMRGNDKGSIITGLHANENYGREVLQLFSIGLYRLWPDGTRVMNSQSTLVPTYDQNTIMGFASTFTGWNYYQTNQANGRLPANFSPSANYTNPMVLVPTHHELGTKQLLDIVMLPAAQGLQTNSTSTNFDIYCSQDLESALDSIFNSQNVGPFVCRELIQRLVTSHPSRDYLYRVVQKFNDNGNGVRGDMQAVIKAVLLDYEARSSAAAAQVTYGKQREPICRVTALARALPAPPSVGGTYVENGNQTLVVTTTNAHRLNNNDTVVLAFTGTLGQPAPPTQSYGVTVTNPSVFTCTAPGLATGTYGQTNGTITLAISGHGLAVNFQIYLAFTTGSGSNGVYQILTVPDANHFTVSASDSTTNFGNCLFPRLTGGGFVVQNRTNVTVATSLMHGLTAGDNVYLNFSQAGSPADGPYTVTSVPDAMHFTVKVATSNNQTQNGLTTYPLVAPHLTRSGNVLVQWSTWNIGATDTGSSASLFQTPLNSPTVFNFYFPDYKFPGTLASAALTTPEFQLTSDTSVALQMNFLEGGILNNGNNTNGLSSFTGGDGDIVLDIGPWMTTNYTSAAGIPGLVDSLNSLLLAGQLSLGAKTNIVNYVTNTVNFGYSSPPTATQMRERVRAVVHQIINSPDFTIQK
jgi:Protein of unknown function (DUF1800)/PA14 domain/CHRD domain/Bacterial TSP3 repeat